MFFKSIAINESILSLSSNEELCKLYKEFIETMMVGPIITVQLWGIEACLDENYKIIKFLRKKLREIGKYSELQYYKEILSVKKGETVAFSEQKDFYRIMVELNESKIRKLFINNSLDEINKKLFKHKKADDLIKEYINKYEWVHTEYISSGWNKKKWLKLFQDAFKSQSKPKDKLKEILDNFNKLNKENINAINELRPNKDVLHAINSLSELISQRDWAKGYFTKLLLSYSQLLNEIAYRMKIKNNEILYYSYNEINEYFKTNKILLKKELESRIKNGYVIEIKKGKMRIISGKKKINQIIKKENIEEPFKKLDPTSSFNGLAASRGIVHGKARVLESASQLSMLKKGEILVTYMTTIEFTQAFRKIKGIVTDEGGMSCHAAIISREFKIPCVVGTNIATRVIKTGDMIKVDGDNGTIKIINKKRDERNTYFLD